MPETLFKVDLTKPMAKQDVPGHNRWHPDIPAVVTVTTSAFPCVLRRRGIARQTRRYISD